MALFTKTTQTTIPNDTNKYVLTDSKLNWLGLSVSYNNNGLVYTECNVSEYTYIMEDTVNCTYKIGKTTNNPELRLTNLRTANPNINMVIVFPINQYTERELHDKFDKYKKDREWFFKVKELTDFVDLHIKRNELIINIYNNLKQLE